MFEHMEIVESIYEGVVENSYKKPTQEDSDRAGIRRNKRGESALSKTHPATGYSAENGKKRYVDCLTSESKTCLIHGPGHSSYECNVLGDFGANYAKGKTTKDHRNLPPAGLIRFN